MHPPSARWQSSPLLWVFSVFIWNILLVRKLFSMEFTKHLGSIEAAFISLSHVMQRHWGERLWWPLWYCGVPFQNTYPPLLHNLVALLAYATGMATGIAYHAVTALAYAVGPVTLCLLVWRLGRSWIPAIAAAAFYSVFSPSAWLLVRVRQDTGGLFAPRRLQALLVYGEGPHILSMTLLPLAVLFLDLAIERRRVGWWLLTALAMVAVVLSNWLGAFALAAAVIAHAFAKPRKGRELALMAVTGVYAYLLAMPWIPPSTLLAVRQNAQRIGGDYRMGLHHVFYLAAAIILYALACRVLWRLQLQTLARFGLLFLLPMAGLVLCAEYLGIAMLPQPERYHLEMEMALAILFGAAATASLRTRNRTVPVLLLLFVVACAGKGGLQFWTSARDWIEPADMRNSVEYQASNWLRENLPGQRVLVPGSVSFWLNAFAPETPQLMGGFDQGIVNYQLPGVHYQLYSGTGFGDRASAIALQLLQAYGVQAIMAGGARSREVYRPYQHLERFKGLPVLWESGDDRIYRVPQSSSSPAHPMTQADLVATGVDFFGLVEALPKYVSAIQKHDPAEWHAHEWGKATILAKLQLGEIVSVQHSYHPGWTARVNGEVRSIRADGLGFMVIAPRCSGQCAVELEFTGGTEGAAALISSVAAVLGGVGALSIERKRRTLIGAAT